MKRSCGCSGGNCGGEVNRREFLQTVLLSTVGVAMGRPHWVEAQNTEVGEWASRKFGAAGHADLRTGRQDRKTPDLVRSEIHIPKSEIQKPRSYQGKNLEYVLMPIGGIGTGTVWLDGKGRLAVWQIFNNFTEEGFEGAMFRIFGKQENGESFERVLQTEAEPGSSYKPFEKLTYEGGYPIARLDFEDKELPVAVRLEAFNPFIPLDTYHSSLPCAIFRWTVTNRSQSSIEVSLKGALPFSGGVEGGPTSLSANPRMAHTEFSRLPHGAVKIRLKSGPEVPAPAMFWLDEVGWSVKNHTIGAYTPLIGKANQIVEKGGLMLLVNPRPDFLKFKQPDWAVFEDFEKGNYAGWTVKGTAFGNAPSSGTTPGQNPVSGFLGKGLVNTYVPNDEPQGELISKPFKIEERYIGFLIGGGDAGGRTCINLKVGGKVVRTAVGKQNERLEPHTWDVAEFKGQDGVIEIIDHHSGGWGHINIDHIVFADQPADHVFSLYEPLQQLRQSLGLEIEDAEVLVGGGQRGVDLRLTETGKSHFTHSDFSDWTFTELIRLKGFRPTSDWQVLIETSQGDPVLLLGKTGNAKVFLCLVNQIPMTWVQTLLLILLGRGLNPDERLVSGHPDWGQVVLATDGHSFLDEMTLRCPLAPLRPGESKTVTFVLSWYYPNVERWGHPGNLYARRFADASAVSKYVLEHLPALWNLTRLYHDTMYQSNLPPMMLDAITSQAVIFRGPTCFWSEDGYFGGYEGSYGCCPLNCTHVWNYAQTHARLFPEIGRNMRESDLLVYLHPNGETSHRQHSPHNAFIDGQCATIAAAYREHLTSPNRAFLDRIWKQVQKATDWLIQAIDWDEDGVPAGHQWNTYDCATSGATTFLGSQYLCALAAAERMAVLQGDSETAQRYRRIREAGTKNQVARLWNGEYYIEIPDPTPAHDYNSGCHSDQLLGQWWAHQLNLGDLYPEKQVESALQAILKHNFREKFAGFNQAPRRYVPDNEGGLLMCTWPRGGRPNPFIIYADEVWTGIEYAVAGLMLWMGQIESAIKIVNMARGRYDGRKREGLNSGPGGNPFNELECGKFYARAMSSYGLLLAAQGALLDGPAGMLGFAPRWQPENHRSFFVGSEGWGLFAQQRTKRTQTDRIELRYGRLRLNRLVFALPESFKLKKVEVKLDGKPISCEHAISGTQVTLSLDRELLCTAPAKLEAKFM